MAKDEMKDLKKLSPEERIRKLKEIEEKSKKEIAEAQKMIKQSSEELKEKKMFEEKVPIPELTAELSQSTEEKEMMEAQRGRKKGLVQEMPMPKQESKLEEQIRSEHIEELARKPAEELKDMMANIYQRAGAQGGQLNEEQKSDVYNIAKAEEEKIYAMKTGEYPTDQMGSALEAISDTFSMGQKLRQMYEGKTEEKGNVRDDYQSGSGGY